MSAKGSTLIYANNVPNRGSNTTQRQVLLQPPTPLPSPLGDLLNAIGSSDNGSLSPVPSVPVSTRRSSTLTTSRRGSRFVRPRRHLHHSSRALAAANASIAPRLVPNDTSLTSRFVTQLCARRTDVAIIVVRAMRSCNCAGPLSHLLILISSSPPS